MDQRNHVFGEDADTPKRRGNYYIFWGGGGSGLLKNTVIVRFPQPLLNYIRTTYYKKISCRRRYILAYMCSSLADTHYFAFTCNRQFKTMSFSVLGVNNSMRRPPVLVALESFNVDVPFNRNVFLPANICTIRAQGDAASCHITLT